MLTKRVIVVLILLLNLVTGNAVQAKSRYSVDQLTAAFIYNISKFAKWPSTLSDREINICMLGGKTQKISAFLKRVIAKKAKTQKITVPEFENANALITAMASGAECHLLLFQSNTFSPLNVHVDKKKTLLIGQSIDFLHQGGMLSLVLENNKMRIYINNDNLNASDIRLGSRFLLIAKAVN